MKQRPVYQYQEIKDYMNCPLCHHIEYIEKQKVSSNYYEENKKIASDESLIETINYYYYLHMENKPPSLKEVYNKYITTLNKKLDLDRNSKDLISEVTSTTTKNITKSGYKYLRYFYKWNANTPQAVIAVNHTFKVAYDELVVEGTFPLIREVKGKGKDRELEVVIFGQLSATSERESLVEETDATLYLKAFKEAFGVTPDNLKVYSIERGKEYEVYRNESDLKRLEHMFLGFHQSVGKVTPYQRVGAHRRRGKFKRECDNYYSSRE